MSKNNFQKFKKTIVAAISFFVLLLLFLFAILLFTVIPQNSSGGFLAFLSACADARVHIIILAVLGGLVGIALLIALLNTVFPFILLLFGKIRTRLSVRTICALNKYSFKSSSRKKTPGGADIEIGMKDKKLHIHFIDVPLSLISVLVFTSDKEYRVYSTARGNLVKLGGGAAVNMTSNRAAVFQEAQRNISEKCKSYAIPQFAPKNSEFHIFVVEPEFARVKYIRGNELVDVSAEVSIGNIIVCKAKTLKKRLKGELHSPLE